MNTNELAQKIEHVLNEACFGGDEHPVEEVAQQHFAASYCQITDGQELDWDGFVEHMRALRRRVDTGRIEILEIVSTGNHFADRHLVTAAKIDGSKVVAEVYMFGELNDEGQFVRITETARVVDGDEADRELARVRD